MQNQMIANGAAPTYAAPTSADTVPIGSVLIVKNASAAAITVTIITPGTLATGDAYPDKVFTVGAGGESWVRVNLTEYQDPTNSSVAKVNFSAVASVTAAAVVL